MDKYQQLCEKYGIIWNMAVSSRLLHLSMDELLEKYQQDPELNNVPKNDWEFLVTCFQRHISGNVSSTDCLGMYKYAAQSICKQKLGI